MEVRRVWPVDATPKRKKKKGAYTPSLLQSQQESQDEAHSHKPHFIGEVIFAICRAIHKQLASPAVNHLDRGSVIRQQHGKHGVDGINHIIGGIGESVVLGVNGDVVSVSFHGINSFRFFVP
nr:MAG TPA: hypothetical protein [Caudoviricetes sp.]